MATSVTRTLYRSLLRVAKRYDKYPALKAMIASDEFTATGLRGLYSPNSGMSLTELVKVNFRSKRDGVELETGFAALRYLNGLANKNFTALFENPNVEILALPESTATTSPTGAEESVASSSPSSLVSTSAPILESRFSKATSYLKKMLTGELKAASKPPEFMASPIMLTSVDKAAATSLDVAAGSSGPKITTEEGALVLHTDPALRGTGANIIKKGVVLAAHPLLGDPFPKCVLLVLRTYSHNRVSVLILNTPQSVELGKHNFIFPAAFRKEPCYIGGFTTLLQEFPPVPNYVILHPYPKLANATVIVDAASAEDSPVCMSSITDLPAILRFIADGKGTVADFRIFIGTVEVTRSALERQIEQGLWMPMTVSPAFVLASAKLGRAGLWHGLLKHCGGEFEQMSLLGQFIETAATPQPHPATPQPESPPQETP